MAISRSSALKINTKTWITFSITIPAGAEHTCGGRASLCSALSVFTLILCVRAPLCVWVGGGEPHIKAERQKNGNSSRAQRQGGLRLIIHQSNVTSQRANNRVDQLHRCCWVGGWRREKIHANTRNCNIQPLRLQHFKSSGDHFWEDSDPDEIWRMKIVWFSNFCSTQSRTSERDPVGPWFTYSARPAHPAVWSQVPRLPQDSWVISLRVHFPCVFACRCGCFSSCVHTRPTGIRCEGGSGAGWVQRGNSCARLQTAFVVARPASVAHMSICMEARIRSLRVHAQTTPKNILHTLHSHGLKGSHWGCRLNLLRGKTDCIWKMKGEGMQAHVYEW